jgi:hypothetical protein
MIAAPCQRNGTFAVSKSHHHDTQVIRQLGFVYQQNDLRVRTDRPQMLQNPPAPCAAALLYIYSAVAQETLYSTLYTVCFPKCPQLLCHYAERAGARQYDTQTEQRQVEGLPVAKGQS